MKTKEEIRAALSPALLMAGMLASYTKTPKDDQAVALLRLIVNSDEIMDAALLLLAKQNQLPA
jgi:hypothetical protein